MKKALLMMLSLLTALFVAGSIMAQDLSSGGNEELAADADRQQLLADIASDRTFYVNDILSMWGGDDNWQLKAELATASGNELAALMDATKADQVNEILSGGVSVPDDITPPASISRSR